MSTSSTQPKGSIPLSRLGCFAHTLVASKGDASGLDIRTLNIQGLTLRDQWLHVQRGRKTPQMTSLATGSEGRRVIAVNSARLTRRGKRDCLPRAIVSPTIPKARTRARIRTTAKVQDPQTVPTAIGRRLPIVSPTIASAAATVVGAASKAMDQGLTTAPSSALLLPILRLVVRIQLRRHPQLLHLANSATHHRRKLRNASRVLLTTTRECCIQVRGH